MEIWFYKSESACQTKSTLKLRQVMNESLKDAENATNSTQIKKSNYKKGMIRVLIVTTILFGLIGGFANRSSDEEPYRPKWFFTELTKHILDEASSVSCKDGTLAISKDWQPKPLNYLVLSNKVNSQGVLTPITDDCNWLRLYASYLGEDYIKNNNIKVSEIKESEVTQLLDKTYKKELIQYWWNRIWGGLQVILIYWAVLIGLYLNARLIKWIIDGFKDET